MEISEIIARGGGVKALSTSLGLHHTSLIGWRKAGRIPAERVKAVAEATGIAKHELRPDLFDAPNQSEAA